MNNLRRIARLLWVLVFVPLVCLHAAEPASPGMLGRFHIERDLFLAQFDSKSDVDDIHSQAGVATLLADPRFAGVRYHAVAGAYGTQGGLYVPSNELFDACFGKNWSDAHGNYDRALGEVLRIATSCLEKGGSIWIAEAGQSDFSADLVRRIRETLPALDLKNRIHIVQHSEWNESVTTPADLAYVKETVTYHKIPDGNTVGNGTPGFWSKTPVAWKDHVKNPRLLEIWSLALSIANRYNGVDGRYDNTAIAAGGLDFSDVAETCWIFGFAHLKDAEAFFQKFGQ